MFKRIIIKVGTKVLTNKTGELDHSVIKRLVEQIVDIQKSGCEVVLVSSGAVGSGRAIMKNGSKVETMAEKQVYAAVGQIALMNLYAKYLKKYGVQSAQILVTKEDFRDRIHYENMETCFLNILKSKVLPIVNENDVVAIKELLFTDNDELTSLVALQLDADAVFMLTSVDGVIAGDINGANSSVLSDVTIDELRSVEKFVTLDKSNMGRGGMLTKFAMARKMMSAGITVYLLNGKKGKGILDILNGKKMGTHFIADKKVSSRKRRLAHGDSLARGKIIINKLLEEQILSDKKARSILPVGVVSATGDFKVGDVISIVNQKGRTLGCGITKYDAATVISMVGVKKGRPVIHYDDLFILN